MSKLELVLHIGAPKTATSAIQRHLFDSKDIFSENNINYFNSLCYSKDVPNHINIFFDFTNLSPKLIPALEKSKSAKNIFSTELLFFLINESRFQLEMKEILDYCSQRGMGVKIVGAIREPVSYLLSCYGEDVVGGRCPFVFDDWLESSQGRGHAGVPALMRKWEDLVSKENTRWILYQTEKENPDYLGKMFKEVSGMDLPNPNRQIPVASSRTSVGGSVIEAIRRINAEKYPEWQNFSVQESAYEFANDRSLQVGPATAAAKQNLVLSPSFELQKFSQIVECYHAQMVGLNIDGFSGPPDKLESGRSIYEQLKRIQFDESTVQEHLSAWNGEI